MRISTRGRYALRMLLDLAENQGEGYVALKDVALRQEVSKKYLEQIIPNLNRAGLLQTSRGFQGGYRLAKPPELCVVGDVLRATEGGVSPVPCLEQKPNTCSRSEDCATLFLWEGLEKTVNDYLDGITLRDILDHKQERAGRKGP